jgi:hypothetical protein
MINDRNVTLADRDRQGDILLRENGTAAAVRCSV